MDKSPRYKNKNNKKQSTAKPKTAKKRTSKCDGPSCSMFLADLTRKFAAKRRQESETPRNVVQSIVDSITNALPIKISKRPSPKTESPLKIETLQALSPELLPNDTISIRHALPIETEDVVMRDIVTTADPSGFKMPKMPLVSSEVMKIAVEKRRKSLLTDAETTMSSDHDMASEIAKHVETLKKISLIAEEFNQKTAKNLKEIVDSVQEDLVKKLEEIQAEQRAKALAETQALEILEAEQTKGE